LVLLASLLGKITLIDATNTPEHYVTVRDVIGDLPSIQAGEKHPEDVLHCARALSPLNLERIQHTPAGGGWSSWPEHLRLACHKKESGKSYGSVYGRIVWDAVAPTITTQCTSYGSGRFGHPEQNRAISVREAALLQTFPADYKLNDPDGELYYTILARQIGNAVPVRLGQVIAQSIKAHLGARTIAES
jgi:DNA (cytosine-5)-methyltransferase 1